jgi:hypothetical protein
MKTLTLISIFLLFLVVVSAAPGERPRVFVLTDIENEPDDAQSMVRFLVYSNHFDVEGLVATTSTHLRNKTAEWRIQEIVEAYGKVRENLLLHEPGFPTAAGLVSVIKRGIPRYGMTGVGQEMDSEGSEWLIEVADREDPRPLWVTVWGGPNVLAQALWKIRQTRTPAELARFVAKLRVYTISDQDDSAFWIRKSFPNLFYIVSPGENNRHATWSGISGEPWYRFASGADTSLVQTPWLRENIINNHGPLGEEYPEVEYSMEGDTPSFLSLISNGLNDPDRPDYGGWGGRYEFYQPRFLPYRNNARTEPEPRPIWTDTMDEVVGRDGLIYIDNHATIWRWREAFQNDFAARMDWCVKPYGAANHPPTPTIDGPKELSVQAGSRITLDASGSSDPDGDNLRFKWIHYPEPGNFWDWRSLVIEPAEGPSTEVSFPVQASGSVPQTTHIVLEVTDSGTPSLTRYERVILHLMPAQKQGQ